MTRPTTPPILSELRSSTSPASQVAALRALKTELVGHEQKKRIWVGLGVLIPIARILNTFKGSGKRRDPNENGTAHCCRAPSTRTDDEEARLQAIIIVGSLAHGGPVYIPPIKAAGVIVPMLSLLSSTESSASTVLAILRTLNTIADASARVHLNAKDRYKGIFHSLYTDEVLASIVQLLSQSSTSYSVQQQTALAAALIAKTCRHESQRNILVRTGVLDALASRLSAFVAAPDYPSFTARRAASENPGIVSATAQLQLAPILGAIGTIITTSRSRALHFLSTPALTAVLLRLEADIALPHEKKATSWHHFTSASAGPRASPPRGLDYLLPQVPFFPSKGTQPEISFHPPFGAVGTSTRQPYSAKGLHHANGMTHGQTTDSPQEEENPLIVWLICVVRASSGLTRLMAAWIISLFHLSGLIDKRRESSFALLLIPLLVRLLEKEPMSAVEARLAYDASPLRSANLTSQEQAPAILATLMIDNIDSQRAAVEAGAIKKLAQLLKDSYNPLPTDSNTSQWTAEPSLEDGSDGINEEQCTITSKISASGCQVAKLRESVLLALASLASIRDDFRKMIIENGVVPFMIESLKPCHRFSPRESSGNTPDVSRQDSSSQIENPVGVILAACGATRSLSRSVTTLRTSLMDAGVAAPLFVLLKHYDVNVKVAATSVISNLVLEFSPMREAILEAGILKMLCDHARCMDLNLRLSSIWALKHLVVAAPKHLKRDCLDELGPGWLKQIVCDDLGDPASASGVRSDREASVGTPLAMGTPNAAGEQVDLLNATDRPREGGHVANEEGEEDLQMVDSVGALSHPDPDPQQQDEFQNSWRASRGRNGRTATSQLRADDLAVQKEGLDFIRNLICGNDAFEMIDYLFEELGQDKMFEILISKLRPRLANAFNRDRRSLENRVRQTQPQTDIVISVCYIVVHLAAGLPRHKQSLISQPELLKLILPLFAHPHHEVRTCCAWIVINLTWMDDQSDHPGCRERAQELMRLGWYEKLQILETDPELDVRERTKTALHQMNCAIR
ncbi:MAG: hypothetical protein Q9225_003844 [Loekoesia sp. 1 TL-2023]